ncbi:MAG: GAF domain-containing protein, partial [Spirochaetes bacterium]|nr:GAF domain-containing protein [Spirochaetota bacterium]
MKRDAEKLFRTIETLFTIKDLDSLLESVLTEARRFVNADAGTIYLAAKGHLFFSFVQNDTLFKGQTKDKYIPTGSALPIDKKSIAGYVAKTGDPILIDDVYHIQSDVSFSFNPSFDKSTNYRTQSILGVPLKTRENEIVGVLQLINAKNEAGDVAAFSMDDRLFISQFALNAA